MNFNDHSKYEGAHAFLSASNHAWVNYDEEKMIRVYSNKMAAIKVTELLACILMMLSDTK